MANKNTLQSRRIYRKTAKTGGRDVISQNEGRNMQEIVLHNKGEDGKTYSVTKHTPIRPTKEFRPYTWVKSRLAEQGRE